MNKVCVLGLWHLGAVYSACLSELGYQVTGYDPDKNRVKNLNLGSAPLFEPELDNLISKNIRSNRLIFTSNLRSAVEGAKTVIIAFDTPVNDNDEVDLTEIYNVAKMLAKCLEDDSTVIVSSQVPVGTCDELRWIIDRDSLNMYIAYVPENLRLGQAIKSFMYPERIVIGAENKETLDKVEAFFSVIPAPKIRMNLASAEITKHALNAFLATEISFANEIANICNRVGADMTKVTEALKTDSRIGSQARLNAGLGFSGGTLARDVKALQKIGKEKGYTTSLLNSVLDVNKRQNKVVIEKLEKVLGSLNGLTIGVFGLTYKAETSTLKRSVSIEVIKDLIKLGAKVKAYDPEADLSELDNCGRNLFKICDCPYEVAKDVDAVIFMTYKDAYQQLDFQDLKEAMKTLIIVDPNNLFSQEDLRQQGFIYIGVGRGK